MEQYPDIKVDYTPLDLQLYNEKMVALFNAGTQPDCYYVRDTNLGAWVEAGWMQPIDGLPGLAELDQDIFPFNRRRSATKASSTARRTTATSTSTCTTRRPPRRPGWTSRRSRSRRSSRPRSPSKRTRHGRVPDPQGLQDQRRRARRVLVDGLRLGRQPLRRGAEPRLSGQGQDRPRRARVDGPGDARLEDPRSAGARARRDPGARRLRQRPGLLHVQRRQRASRAPTIPSSASGPATSARSAFPASTTPARGRWAGPGSTASTPRPR